MAKVKAAPFNPIVVTANFDYVGYIGGSGDDFGFGIAIDSSGNAYVTGETTSTQDTNFPVTVGPDLTQNGGTDAFVAKVNSGGTTLTYAGFIGGSGTDAGTGIAVDSSGNAYVTGDTDSTQSTFPETGGPDLTQNGGIDAFVVKVNSGGTALTYAGFIGGDDTDIGTGIAVDSSGNAYVTGETSSTEATFPETGGPDLTRNVSTDAFVAKVGIVASCGDAVVEGSEACDDANIANGDGCSSTCANEVTPACGDAILQSGEACDDGNTTNGDGCSSSCANEVEPACGDNILQSGEACEDGNAASGDGCSSTCQNEGEVACGDGILQQGEGCDDGNTTAGDGCSATCTEEAETEEAEEEDGGGGGGCSLIPRALSR